MTTNESEKEFLFQRKIRKIKQDRWRRFSEDSEKYLYEPQRKVWKLLRSWKVEISEIQNIYIGQINLKR